MPVPGWSLAVAQASPVQLPDAALLLVPWAQRRPRLLSSAGVWPGKSGADPVWTCRPGPTSRQLHPSLPKVDMATQLWQILWRVFLKSYQGMEM